MPPSAPGHGSRPDYRTAYQDLAGAERGPSLARVERLLLVDTLRSLGPDRPTMCEGWTTHHLVAHIKLREGNPWDETRNLLNGDAAVESTVRHHPFDELVDRVEAGPPWLSPFRLPRLDPILNSLELYVHHEDARRAQDGWEPRPLPTWAEDQLWRATVSVTKYALRKERVGVTLERTDTGIRHEARAAQVPGEAVVLAGLPSESILFLFGRAAVADVDIIGPDDAVSTFTRAPHST